MTTRREMIKGTLGAAAIMAVPGATQASARERYTDAQNHLATTKKQPVTDHGAFQMLPIGQVRPAGWLARQLRIQADGLSGHLDEFWPDVGPNSGWLGGSGESWERGPYFLDGLIPLAWLTGDETLKGKARKFVEWTLTHQASNGMIGPPTNDDWWPRMVMVKALAQYHEATGDPRVLDVLTRYFHHQLEAMPARPLKEWGKYRWQDQVFVVLWLHRQTGDPKLLALCNLLREQGFDWTASFNNFQLKQPVTRVEIGLTDAGIAHQVLAMQAHGVNNGQALKTAPVEYLLNGNPAEKHNYDLQLAALDTYHGEPNGMFSCDEHLGGTDPSHGTELCTVVETMFSMEVALAAFGDPSIGDRIEKIAFNALPGTFTDDMWAHQYDQQSNQVQVGLLTKPWTTNGPESNLFGLEPHFGCCTANFHQGWPKFVASLWMKIPDESLVAALYSPCEVETTVRNVGVRLSQATEYPFRNSVHITVDPDRPIAFPLLLRIPAWSRNTQITVNGKVIQENIQAGSFHRVDRTWNRGDRVEIVFSMEPRLTRWQARSVAVERGPLVFSLSPGENWVKLRDRGLTADWQVFPGKPWNYGLQVEEATAATLRTVERPVPAIPFSAAPPAVAILLKGRRLPQWRSEDGVAGPPPQSPAASQEPEEDITLLPYAAAKLRITAFPQILPQRPTST